MRRLLRELRLDGASGKVHYPAFVLEFQRSTLAHPVPQAFLDTVVRESLKVPARVWRATFADFLKADFSTELNTIKPPTFILWGDRDEYFPRVDQMALQAAIPRSRFVVYSGGGHAFHWEDPARFASDLAGMAQEIAPGVLKVC